MKDSMGPFKTVPQSKLMYEREGSYIFNLHSLLVDKVVVLG